MLRFLLPGSGGPDFRRWRNLTPCRTKVRSCSLTLLGGSLDSAPARQGGERKTRIDMRHVLRVVLLLMMGGSFALGCDVQPYNDVGAPGDESVIREDDPHLPGSCTNPVACGTTTGVDPNGQGGGSGTPVEYCTGCVCTPNPASCTSCVARCLHAREICLYNGGGSSCGTGGDCNAACDAENLVCACPSQHH